MTGHPLIVGADISSRSIALVARHPLTPTAMVVKYEVSDGKRPFSSFNCGEALGCMYEFVDQVSVMAVPGSPRLAYIEAPVVAGARNIQSTVKQAYINGVVQAAFVQAGFTVEMVPISTWKMVVVGNGSASKEQVARRIRGRWAPVHRSAAGDQDLLDAAAICLYGEQHARRQLV